ncbi:putative F-box domain, galactose oxidase/kelch, beta-propeller, F-box associated interaction [Lupinus albus]|uniref:Putative F-box domain, galactose oxidase/kelch, beta-propeller, F-box associated interaction n=1 Tax=Lupinus albus TaxID=3870 RepID=A0A6A4QSV6_LUPAL|nr:putative F-box domain, galactose oxidase/kelch, beta-propeller, F-box associated interaction [Lupinus albus]KAE9617885.1 putative F-box domain, galactose oxidase/kelch, beta-propeller, F-box associated interaction [Lupinus albus]
MAKRDKQRRKKPKTTYTLFITSLPNHILQNIFSRLPVRTIISCKCVSKEWNNMTNDPIFKREHFSKKTVSPILRTFEPRFWPTDLHLIEAICTDDLVFHQELHSKISPPHVPFTYVPNELNISKFGIVNSCNGLLCICTTPFNNPIYVCNPITGEYIMLPKPKMNPGLFCYQMDEEGKSELYMTNFVVSGFGFNPKTNQYKVMRMMELETTQETRYVTIQVLTLGSTSWETIGSIQSWDSIGLRLEQIGAPIIQEASYKKSFCVYLNGAVHWLCNSTYNTMFIASFNFENENIVEILPPSQLRYQGKQGVGNMRLGVLNDCLYLTDVDSYVNFKIWVLKDYNDPKISWTLHLIIDTISLNIWPRGLYQPIKYLQNGDLFMFHPSNALVCYNPNQKTFRYFKIHGIDSDFEMVPHIPCLLPIKDVVRVEDPHLHILNIRSYFTTSLFIF